MLGFFRDKTTASAFTVLIDRRLYGDRNTTGETQRKKFSLTVILDSKKKNFRPK